MFRFTIRDVLWLTVVLAVAVAWYWDRSAARKLAWQQLSKNFYEGNIREQETMRLLEKARQQLTRGAQEREQLEEQIREKQLQIEQLLAAPSLVSNSEEE